MPNIKLLVLLLACLNWLPLLAADVAPPQATVSAAASAGPAGVVKIFNREIVTFRSAFYGVSAQDRAQRARVRLIELLGMAGPHQVSQKAEPLGVMLQINGATAFWIAPGDADTVSGQTLQTLVADATAALETAIAASRESRDTDALLRALSMAALASAAVLALVWLANKVRGKAELWLTGILQQHADQLRLGGMPLLRQERGVVIVQNLLLGLYRVLLFVLAYKWLSFVLASFPYTRVWGELLDGYLWSLAGIIGTGVADAIPGLFTALVIFYLTRVFTRVLDGFFERVRTAQIEVSWLGADVAEPTRRIAKVVVWLFALAMAYPYLPGAQTQAFQGLSVLVGLMISLGSSNLVGQAASGLILTYGRVFRKGEYVRIAEHEGTITEQGMFATRLRTGLGEELTLANATVLNATTKNYSRVSQGSGFVLDTTVTIGYDTPWRQVHALLMQAAQRTVGILKEPAPVVFQTALSDWYPQYRLVCQASAIEPRSRAMLLSALHANIQDVFNEYGVQIMSPQYIADPASAKIVPPDQWFAAPAVKPSEH